MAAPTRDCLIQHATEAAQAQPSPKPRTDTVHRLIMMLASETRDEEARALAARMGIPETEMNVVLAMGQAEDGRLDAALDTASKPMGTQARRNVLAAIATGFQYQGDNIRSREVVRKALENVPADANGTVKLGAALMLAGIGDSDRAWELFEQITPALLPEHEQPMIPALLAALGERERAMSTAESLWNSGHRDKAYTGVAGALALRGDFAGAFDAAEKIGSGGAYAQTIKSIGKHAVKLGKWPAFEARMPEMVAAARERGDLWQLATAFISLKQLDAARAIAVELEASLAKAPKNQVMAQYGVTATLYRKLGENTKALEIAHAARDRERAEGFRHALDLARMLMDMGDAAGGREMLDLALAQDGKRETTEFGRAISAMSLAPVLAQAGEVDKAIALYDETPGMRNQDAQIGMMGAQLAREGHEGIAIRLLFGRLRNSPAFGELLVAVFAVLGPEMDT
ncbi:MAG: hypothetical protein AB7O49_20995 [Sphingomonadales bacterium]